MADKIHASDFYLNRAAVTNAQSTALWASQLSARNAAEQDADDDEDDFKAMSETAGLGTTWKDADAEIDSMLKRRVQSDDKLLEQILGKKAAAERRKAKAAAKSNIASQHAAPKPLNGICAALQKPASPRQRMQNGGRAEESDAEEDLGRAALVGSKNQTRKNKKRSVHPTQSIEATAQVDQDAEPPDLGQGVATVKAVRREQKENLRNSEDEDEQRPKKNKATSYLDELLSKKKKKKPRAKA